MIDTKDENKSFELVTHTVCPEYVSSTCSLYEHEHLWINPSSVHTR